MTYDQYWYGDTQMARAFWEADRLKQKRVNEEAWLIGAYVRHAIESSICNGFREKGVQPVKYPSRPFGSDEITETDTEDAETVYAKAYMDQMIRAGQNWGKKNGP